MPLLSGSRPGQNLAGALTLFAASLVPSLAAWWAEAAPARPPAPPNAERRTAQKAPDADRRSPIANPTYNRDVRPILAENCFPCHGPDSAARKADLRLDQRDQAIARRAIVPGKPTESGMVTRVFAPVEALRMPPAATHKQLTAVQKDTLKRWIAAGAAYELHWSYIAPQRPAIPAIKNAAWARNPIDAFILARLEKEGLAPAPEADRRALARRLSLDLTGLPPDPAEVEQFVKDPAPDAYEKLVDRYLASPQWGEHRARQWLDVARYADTHGIHFDNYRENWAYRDWVIDAFNRNLPFDEFTIEQLAGDLLPNPTLDQLVATGFNRSNITTNEGGAIAEEYLVLYNRDRTETVGQTWLGTTIGCAVCHDHKFDPFPQRQFYQMAAYFNNTTQAAMDGNIKDTPPVIVVPLAADRARFAALTGALAAARKQVEARKQAARADFDAWLAAASAEKITATIPIDGLRFQAPLAEGEGQEIHATLNGQPLTVSAAATPDWDAGHVAAKAFQRKAGSVVEVPAAGDWEKDEAFSYAAWVKIPRANFGGAVFARMDDQHAHRGWDLWLENGRVGTHLINRWPEDALKVVSREQIKPREWHHVVVTYSGSANPDSLRIYVDGTVMATDVQANGLKSTIRTTVPFKIGQRHSGEGVDGASIADVRLYGRVLSPHEALRLARGTRAAWLATRGSQLAAAEKDELFAWWLPALDEPYRGMVATLTPLETEERAIRERGTTAPVAAERSEPPTAYVLFRGEYDKRRDQVNAATPTVLPPMPADFPKNRLGFAKWLLLPEHPLTARVTVNRFWQEIFGSGLVRTAGDFGVTGELPSHPELLDWLAVSFMTGSVEEWKNGSVQTGSSALPLFRSSTPWDVKSLFRLIVTSSVYRQAAVTTPEKRRKDPQNRLLSRGPRYRMDAEMVRDYALAASGLLVRKFGGPSVRPYQPPGVWEAVAMIGSNTRDYKQDTGENLYRRSMYTFWKRAAPPASMEIFNAPNRETCAVRRERTNTPLQALVTLNDVQFVEAARVLAQNAVKAASSSEGRVDFIARRLLARPLAPAELKIAMQSLADLDAFYGAHSDQAKALVNVGESKPDAALAPEELAAYTMLANQLMNLDEVLNK